MRSSRLIVGSSLAIALLFMGAQNALAQNTGTVSGVVAGTTGQVIVSAQVYLVGTTLGTLTGTNGRYAIVNVPAGNYRIRVEQIGKRSEEAAIVVTAGQTTSHNFTLRDEVLGLDEIVVTGTAGAARRREVGNSIAQINMSQIQEPPRNIDALLQGRASGMTVLPSSAQAGSGAMIRLRGNTSVTMSNQPLIYVDGVRMRSNGYAYNVPAGGIDPLRGPGDVASPLNDLNPNDIERIEIIKGAAASTLYGTEAAAGVIQIFTKRGHTGAPQWTMQIEQGFSRALKFGPDPSRAPPSDTIYSCTSLVNVGGATTCAGTMQAYRDSFPELFSDLPTRGVSRSGGTSSYLFIDPWLRDAYRQRYSMSVGGGTEALRYFVSGQLSDEDAVLPNDNEKRTTVRGNFTFSPMSNVLLLWNTGYTKNKISNTAAGNNAQGMTLNAFRRDRNYRSNDRMAVMDSLLNQEITTEIDHFITSGSVSWSPMTNFTNKFTVGYDLATQDNRNHRPFGNTALVNTGFLTSRRYTFNTLTFDYVGSYNINVPIMDELRSTLSWGAQSITTDRRETSANGNNFPGPFNPVVDNGGTYLGFESRERVVNAGFFGQVLFDLKNRYFLTVGVRVDGNSAFGEDFGLQTYPKVSVSWVASDESFFPKSATLKLRAAVGEAGRAPGAFDAVRTWIPAAWGTTPGFFPNNVGNANLGPERTRELEVGFDGSMLDSRLTTEFTWYHKKTTDALFLTRQIPSLGFFSSQLNNVGEMQNKGVEVSVDAVIIRMRNFQWSLGGGLFTDFSKIITLGDAADFSLGDGAWVMKGQPAPVIRQDFCVENANEKAAPIIRAGTPDNPCIFGPNLPTHTWTARTSITLPYNITLNARAQMEKGGFMEDGAAFNAITRGIFWPGCYDFYTLRETGRLSEARALDRARCEFGSATRQDYFVYPSDYAKLREVSLSIPIPTRLLLGGASSAQLTFAGHNVWKWVNKDFPVFDPETGANGGFERTNIGVRKILEHVPPPATYTASLRVTF